MKIVVSIYLWAAWLAILTVWGLALSASAMFAIPAQPLDAFAPAGLRARRERAALLRQVERYLRTYS